LELGFKIILQNPKYTVNLADIQCKKEVKGKVGIGGGTWVGENTNFHGCGGFRSESPRINTN